MELLSLLADLVKNRVQVFIGGISYNEGIATDFTILSKTPLDQVFLKFALVSNVDANFTLWDNLNQEKEIQAALNGNKDAMSAIDTHLSRKGVFTYMSACDFLQPNSAVCTLTAIPDLTSTKMCMFFEVKEGKQLFHLLIRSDLCAIKLFPFFSQSGCCWCRLVESSLCRFRVHRNHIPRTLLSNTN